MNTLVNKSLFPFSFIVITLGLTSTAYTQKDQTNQHDQEVADMVFKIKTSVDSNYVYPYENSKFVPPAGKTLLVMGQTVERINEYKKAFPKQPNPGGWSAYWAVTEFTGVKEKHTNSTGTSQNHQMLVDTFPNAVLHSAMWMVGKWNVTQNTILGINDKVIKRYAKWIKKVKRPVYLRIGYEFDGPHNVLEPDAYVKAYRHIVDILRAEGVDNVAYVWHSYASMPYKNYPVSDWYPGDDYVDWVGISIFGHAYAEAGIGKEGITVLDFAKAHKKPVMISEANPIFGVDKNNPKVWDDWFVNFFSLVYHKNIKAVCFINEDWTSTNIEGISHWKDARLYNNELVSKAWFKETGKDKYLKASDDLFEQLGYE
ncbi:glycoside hydrolase family 26 protein [Hyunsoonleella flava]|nr:glycosyl hydrolase [Hyunsoonleella flava]